MSPVGTSESDAAPKLDAALSCLRSQGLGWWRGEGNGNDSAGDKHGTVNGGLSFVGGISGQAFSMDGTDDYVKIDDSSTFLPQGSFSVELWMRTEQSIDYWILMAKLECGGAVCNSVNSRAKWQLFSTHVGGVEFWLNDSMSLNTMGQKLQSTATTLNDNNFHHIVAMRDFEKQKLRIYVDGNLDIEKSTNAMSGDPLLNQDGDTDPLVIGARTEPNGDVIDFFPGDIDEVVYYDRALTTDEVNTLYLGTGCP